MKKLGILANRALLVGKKHAPVIMIVGGVIMMGAAVFMSAKATVGLENDIDDHNESVERIREEYEGKENTKEYKKEISKAYCTTAWIMFRKYAPAVGTAVAGAALILGGANIMNRRNAALMAAYRTLDETFKTYRKRVKDEFGEDGDRHFMYGEKTVVQKKKDGTEDVMGKQIDREQIDGFSQFARFFDSSSEEWVDDAGLNFAFLKGVEARMNDRLARKGCVFLNEVYDALGMRPSQAGAVCGWLKDSVKGDGYISFGLFDPNEAGRRFVNGLENVVLLDFNVEGVIYDLI